ncbi:DUF1398 family protein [Mycobacterium sp. 236(2023)]|uniref:DUF1398 domain-containing protein n=1 Tax=Mycobacterium sp. 236(2023) TaxID=3038163 RepID=UPI0024154C8B|nr:DUF1398 family protein [Mycobacterium sp. 236(2023)]MDG4669086.1 DUF1398 family protein [Mycobacterium sp. 236(2023)]
MSESVSNVERALREAAANRTVRQGFPYLAETLRQAGVRRNVWHLPAMQATYYTDLGPVVSQGSPLISGFAEVPAFDADRLVAALRADQAGNTTFPEFVAAAWQAGVVRYVVDLKMRTCVYYGHSGASYTETYPAVSLAG